eukprot:TRINITY_DN66599_c0_g1_i13.p4 TRINITY_DN66599_c0_g1~~TRINITY_DN66599_c0_g1_i13.p4  ORF type:complete len:101 (-),score=8.97 TRINITY_DN66599_c0_g1_i13:798-1100(-)
MCREMTDVLVEDLQVIEPTTHHRLGHSVYSTRATHFHQNSIWASFALPLLAGCKAQSTKKRTGYTGSKEYCNAQKFASLTTPFFVGNTFATVHSGHHSSM